MLLPPKLAPITGLGVGGVGGGSTLGSPSRNVQGFLCERARENREMLGAMVQLDELFRSSFPGPERGNSYAMRCLSAESSQSLEEENSKPDDDDGAMGYVFLQTRAPVHQENRGSLPPSWGAGRK